jgi:hypothetical protein
MGVHATFSELHTIQAGLPQGRAAELMGRTASAGEQLGLAWTAQQDAERWISKVAASDHQVVAARSLAEIAGYYAISAGHGLCNVTVRSLTMNSATEAVLASEFRNANGFRPFDANPQAWLPLNEKVARKMATAAAAISKPALTGLVDLVLKLTQHPDWQALMNRRAVDFHRLRPQSVDGGVMTSNPWKNDASGGASLSMYSKSQHKAPVAADLVAESSDAIEVLAHTMTEWLDAWPDALRDLGVPLFK